MRFGMHGVPTVPRHSGVLGATPVATAPAAATLATATTVTVTRLLLWATSVLLRICILVTLPQKVCRMLDAT